MESSRCSSKTLQKGSCPYALLDEALRYQRYLIVINFCGYFRLRAGAAAIFLSRYPDLTPAQVRDALLDQGTDDLAPSWGYSNYANLLLYVGQEAEEWEPSTGSIRKPSYENLLLLLFMAISYI